MMPGPSAGEVRWAVRTVYGPGAGESQLASLDEPGLRGAFRRRARDAHPDRARALGRDEARLAEEFRHLRQAYEVLLLWLSLPRRPAVAAVPPRSAAPVARPPSPSPGPTVRPRRPAPAPVPPASPPVPPRSSPGPGFGAFRLPPRPLLLAEFLHLGGVVDWRQRIAAIVWQRRQRPQIGAIAQQWGYLDEAALRRVLAEGRPGERFGETALRLGLINGFQHHALVGRQRRLQVPIGRYFVYAGILSESQLQAGLRALAEHNRRQQGGWRG